MFKRVAVAGLLMFSAAAVGYLAVRYLMPLSDAQITSNSLSGPSKRVAESAKDDKAYYIRRNEFGSAVVPGGVYNQATLIEHASLYPMCDISNAHFSTLPAPLTSHVSYIHDGKMYWTTKTRTLPKGEFVIYAGQCVILQRCGNLLDMQSSDLPHPVLQNEPIDVYPPEVTTPSSQLEPFVTQPTHDPLPANHSTTNSVPPSNYIGQPAAIFVPGSGVPPPTIVNTPEPGTVFMVFFGALVIAPKVFKSWLR